MTWQILDSNYERKITVIGVGGGGGNSVHHMIKSIRIDLSVQMQIRT